MLVANKKVINKIFLSTETQDRRMLGGNGFNIQSEKLMLLR